MSLTHPDKIRTIQTEKTRHELKMGQDGMFRVGSSHTKIPHQQSAGWYPLVVKGSGLGLSLALPMVLLTILGVSADRQFMTKPLLTLIGFGFGTVIGVISFIKSAQELLKK